MKIDGNTQIIGFLGSTYKTTKMYAMYNAAFEVLHLNYIYIPLVADNLKKAVDGIRNLGIKAVGVTIPYKIEILKYLDELDNNTKRIGAVNVVINQNGKLIGGNTDGLGGIKALKGVTKIFGKKIILLGAGGAARALAFTIIDEGGDLIILNRTAKPAEDLAKVVRCKYGTLDQLNQEITDTDIIINATSMGMFPNVSESLIPIELLRSSLIVQELVTNPKETKLLKESKKKGCKIVYGEKMLFWQAVYKFKMFTGVDAPVNVMKEAIKYA